MYVVSPAPAVYRESSQVTLPSASAFDSDMSEGRRCLQLIWLLQALRISQIHICSMPRPAQLCLDLAVKSPRRDMQFWWATSAIGTIFDLIDMATWSLGSLLNSAQFSSVRFSLVHLGSVRFDSSRCGAVAHLKSDGTFVVLFVRHRPNQIFLHAIRCQNSIKAVGLVMSCQQYAGSMQCKLSLSLSLSASPSSWENAHKYAFNLHWHVVLVRTVIVPCRRCCCCCLYCVLATILLSE